MSPPSLSITSAADLHGRDVLVLGLARSGLAATRYLASVGARVTAYDRRDAAALPDAVAALSGLPVELALAIAPEAAARLLAAADLIVSSPSISARFPRGARSSSPGSARRTARTSPSRSWSIAWRSLVE